jgi:hypothetical protein
MYTAPIQEALQMIRARISTAAIVDSLAQHVLCFIMRLFGAYGPPDEKYTYIHTFLVPVVSILIVFEGKQCGSVLYAPKSLIRARILNYSRTFKPTSNRGNVNVQFY